MCASYILRRAVAGYCCPPIPHLCFGWRIVTFLVAVLLASSSAESGDILEGPIPMNTSLGTIVEYNCSVEGTILYWVIDGSTVFPVEIEHVIKMAKISDLPAIVSSYLTFTATSTVNGSNIACNSHTTSAPVSLFIQGPLAAVENLAAMVVGNVSQTIKSNVTYQLSWDEPYSVLGVPILGYKVTTLGLHSQVLVSTNFITNTALLMVDICDDYNFSVIPVNGAGDGSISSIFIYHLEAPSVLAASTVLTQPDIAELLVEADFTIMLNHSCAGKVEEYVKVTVNDKVYTFGPFWPIGDLISFVIKELTRSQHYNVSVWVENIDGKSNAIEMALSTFAVQGVDYFVDGQRTLCIKCLFSSGLSSSGCFVVLTETEGQGSITVRISRSNGAPSAMECIGSFSTGVYHFTIYDVLDDGQKQNIVAFEKDNVTIVISSGDAITTLTAVTNYPVPSSPNESPTSRGSTSPNIPVIGGAIVIGLLVGVLAVTLLATAITCIIFKHRRSKQWTFNNARQRGNESHLQRQQNNYEISHILHLSSSAEQNPTTHVSAEAIMTMTETPPILPAQPDRRSLMLESEKQFDMESLRKSNSQPLFSGESRGGGEQSSDHTSYRVTTPLRDTAASIIADPMALNTSVMESPPSYMNLALSTAHHVRNSSSASGEAQRLSTEYEARAYDELSQEPKVDYGRQMHLQYYLQSMMDDSEPDFNANSTQRLARQRTGEVAYAQLDISSLQHRQPGEEIGMPNPLYQSITSSDRVEYASVVHSPYRHDQFFSEKSTASLV